jgi:hypothetical protein
MSQTTMRKRGWVYIVIGAILYVLGIAGILPLVVRGTSIPFAPVVAALGVLLLVWDYVQARKGGRSTDAP